jgi:hypothetical protein
MIVTSAPSPQAVISDVSDRLVHMHAALDLILPRVGQTYSADGVRRELRTIGDELLALSTQLHGALADMCVDGS